MATRMKVVASLVETHAHSPGDTNQGGDYPPRLVYIITLYEKLMNLSEETCTPNVSALNYTMHDNVVGVNAPLGTNSEAVARFSTREDNGRLGISLVK